MKIRPEQKFRPVRNNKNNSILAKFATYDGFMVKKKKYLLFSIYQADGQKCQPYLPNFTSKKNQIYWQTPKRVG